MKERKYLKLLHVLIFNIPLLMLFNYLKINVLINLDLIVIPIFIFILIVLLYSLYLFIFKRKRANKDIDIFRVVTYSFTCLTILFLSTLVINSAYKAKESHFENFKIKKIDYGKNISSFSLENEDELYDLKVDLDLISGIPKENDIIKIKYAKGFFSLPIIQRIECFN